MAQRSKYATSLAKPPSSQDPPAQLALRSEMSQSHPFRRASEPEDAEAPVAQPAAAVETPTAEVSKALPPVAIEAVVKDPVVLAPVVQARIAEAPPAQARAEPGAKTRDLDLDEVGADMDVGEATVEIVKDAARRAPATPAPALVADRFAVRFLGPQTLDKYLAFAASNDDEPDYLIASHVAGFKADAQNVPLELCEYLAYKSVLAYEADKAAISRHFDRCGWRGIKRDSLEFFDTKEKGDTQGFGYVSGDTAFIVMRGTTSATDWMNDLTTSVTTDDDVSAGDLAVIGDREPRRHLGFARAWGHAAKDIEDWFKKVRAEHGAKHLCFSGHSLGGALALVGAHDFAKRNIAIADAVITYAAPKVGAKEFRDEYTALGTIRAHAAL